MLVQTQLGAGKKTEQETTSIPDLHAENGFYGAPRRDSTTVPQGEVRVLRYAA